MTGTTGLVLETTEAKIDAFQRALISECDRAVRQALRGERDTDGRLYDTVFGLIIAERVYPLLQAARDDEVWKIEAMLRSLADTNDQEADNLEAVRAWEFSNVARGIATDMRKAADAIASRSYR